MSTKPYELKCNNNRKLKKSFLIGKNENNKKMHCSINEINQNFQVK